VERLRLFTPSGEASAPLPRAALGISRRQLDQTLLEQAERLGTRVERGVTAREIEGASVHIESDTITAKHLLLASGKHDVRGAGRPRVDGDPALGLRVRLGPASALFRMLDRSIELHLFEGGYAGLVLQEDGSANLCLAVRKSRLGAAGGPAGLLQAIGRELPVLADRLAWLEEPAAIDAIGAVPYGWRTAATEPGIYRLGDQAGVIPSLAGEGMGIALASGMLAGQSILQAESASSFQRALARRTARPITVARAVLALAERPRSAALLVPLVGRMPVLATLLARATRISH
jgi:flavin-dependent dehydrogenase